MVPILNFPCNPTIFHRQPFLALETALPGQASEISEAMREVRVLKPGAINLDRWPKKARNASGKP
jgi:hypothetical protein